MDHKSWARDALHSLLVQVLNKGISQAEMQRTNLERQLRKLRTDRAEQRAKDDSARRPD